uniref:Im:7152348 n=1 Tax=Dicentrarchus labrax TaxID=13489 RepID=A0A8C4HU77_DICLA
MVLCEDDECSVCLSPYSRMDRIPRVLHCRHTFCDLCLETMSEARSGLLTVGCPLCRRVTCIGRGLSLQEALWVNSRLWDQIPEEEEAEEEEEDGLKGEAEVERMETKQPTEWWVQQTRTWAKSKLVLCNYRFSFLVCGDFQDCLHKQMTSTNRKLCDL